MESLRHRRGVAGHGQLCRGDEVGQLLDHHEAYIEYIADVATSSYAAGLTPLEAAQREKDGAYADLREGERVVCNLHRAYAELTDYVSPVELRIPSLWPEMIAPTGVAPSRRTPEFGHAQ